LHASTKPTPPNAITSRQIELLGNLRVTPFRDGFPLCSASFGFLG
jgi:hypothetical protein